MNPDSYNDFLQPLPADRRNAVKAWLGSTVEACAACEQPIRVMDSHRLTKAGLAHAACASGEPY